MSLSIKSFEMLDVPGVKKLADSEIGQDYYSEAELVQIQRQSVRRGQNASFLLVDEDEIFGFRLSYPAGNWMSGKGDRISDQLWDFPIEKTAYFQSLFIHKKRQNQGWGKKLSQKSIDVLVSLGAKGVACHSWMESPGGSSRKYLLSLGFKSIAIYKEYWKNVDYKCPRCGKPCLCTAEEMYLNLENYP